MATNYWKQKIHLDWNKDGIKSMSNKRKRADTIIAICSRIGDRLKSMNLSFLEIDWKDDEFVSIGRLCPNISSITFDDNPPISQCCPATIRFESFKCLKELRFPPKVNINSSILNSIPQSIEILIGVDGSGDNIFAKSEDFVNFFRNHPSLIEIEAQYLRSKGNGLANIFPIISQFCPRLKKINLYKCSFTLDGIECLEGMKVLKLLSTDSSLKLSDEQMIEICNRNPDLEVIDIYPHVSALTIRSFESISELKKLRELNAVGWNGDELSSDEQQRIVQKVTINSGASLESLELPYRWFLTTSTIEKIAEMCPVLRSVSLFVTPESATPESIRYLIDRIFKRPKWMSNKDELEMCVWVKRGDGKGAEAAFAPFKALESPEAQLPNRVTSLMSVTLGYDLMVTELSSSYI